MKRLDIDILLQEGEGTMLEYKENLSSSFARELAAMANTAGGKILLGVRDDGTIKGFLDSNEQRARIQDIARNCDPPVKVLVQRVGEVIVVTVRESNAKPVQCSDGFFWRQGAVTQKLSRDENGFFTAIFHPNPEVRAQADTRQKPGTAQVPPKYPPSTPQVVAMLARAENGATRDELQKVTGLRDRKHFRVALLDRFIQEGILEMTIPEKPRSSKQRYRLTQKGRTVLESGGDHS